MIIANTLLTSEKEQHLCPTITVNTLFNNLSIKEQNGWSQSVLYIIQRLHFKTKTHCGHVNSGGLGLAETDPSLLVQEGGVNVAEPSEHLPGGGTHRDTGRVWRWGARNGQSMDQCTLEMVVVRRCFVKQQQCGATVDC